MFVPNVIKDSIRLGPEKLNIKGVEFCNIYRRRKTTQLSFVEWSLISHLKIFLCTQFTIVHIMQTKSVTQYRLAPCVMPRLISRIKMQITECLQRW